MAKFLPVTPNPNQNSSIFQARVERSDEIKEEDFEFAVSCSVECEGHVTFSLLFYRMVGLQFVGPAMATTVTV